jgi:hypothetical protein
VKVIDYIDGIFGCDALIFLYLAELEMFELVEEQLALHEIVIFGHFGHFLLDIAVLFGHELVQPLFHFIEYKYQVFAIF